MRATMPSRAGRPPRPWPPAASAVATPSSGLARPADTTAPSPPPLEPGLRDEYGVPRHHRHILGKIAVLEQIAEADSERLRSARFLPHDQRPITGRKPRQPLCRDHRVEHRHPLAIRDLQRLLHLADDADIPLGWTDRPLDHDGHVGLLDILAQPRLERMGELGWRAAGGADIGGQRGGDQPVRADGNDGAQLGSAIDEHVQLVPGADDIFAGIARLDADQARGRGMAGCRQHRQAGEKPIAPPFSPRDERQNPDHRCPTPSRAPGGRQVASLRAAPSDETATHTLDLSCIPSLASTSADECYVYIIIGNSTTISFPEVWILTQFRF